MGLDVFSNCSDGDVRLVGGAVEYEGLLEICVNGAWGAVCYGTSSNLYSNYWDVTDARVVCRQLGHQEYGMVWLLMHEIAIYVCLCGFLLSIFMLSKYADFV